MNRSQRFFQRKRSRCPSLATRGCAIREIREPLVAPEIRSGFDDNCSQALIKRRRKKAHIEDARANVFCASEYWNPRRKMILIWTSEDGWRTKSRMVMRFLEFLLHAKEAMALQIRCAIRLSVVRATNTFILHRLLSFRLGGAAR